jgi:hypothetical protein
LSRFHLIEKPCEASLKRLGADQFDLYQLHEWDGQTPLEETFEALDSLVRSGMVRYVGVSNFPGWHLLKMISVSELMKLVRPISQQILSTLQAREAERFGNPRQLMSYLGLTPPEHSSGTAIRRGGIAEASNASREPRPIECRPASAASCTTESRGLPKSSATLPGKRKSGSAPDIAGSRRPLLRVDQHDGGVALSLACVGAGGLGREWVCPRLVGASGDPAASEARSRRSSRAASGSSGGGEEAVPFVLARLGKALGQRGSRPGRHHSVTVGGGTASSRYTRAASS